MNLMILLHKKTLKLLIVNKQFLFETRNPPPTQIYLYIFYYDYMTDIL